MHIAIHSAPAFQANNYLFFRESIAEVKFEWWSQSVTHGIAGQWPSLQVDGLQSKDVTYCTSAVLHGPEKILRYFQVKGLVTWHICLGGMLHLREIPRFSKKKQNTILQAGIFPQIFTHIFMNQNLTRHFRCGINSCIRFLKEKVIFIPMWF